MKKTLLKSLLVAGMLAVSAGVQAGDFTDGGKYYLQNVGTNQWWGCGNSWGTQASLVKHPEFQILHEQPDGAYQMETQVSNGGTQYYFNGEWMDNGSPMNLTFAVDGGYYTIAAPSGNLFGYNGSSTVMGNNVAVGNDAYWLVYSHQEMVESLAVAKVTEARDATFLFLNPNFSRNNRYKGAWEGADYGVGGREPNTNAEKWGGNSQEFNISQTAEVPNGVYRITWNGFYRYNNTGDNTNQVAIDTHANNTEVINSFVYIDETDYPLTSIADEAATQAFGKLPFSQADATDAFGQGLYAQEAYVQVTDGNLTIGIKKIQHPGCDWTVWDNFELTYFGNECTIEQAQNAALFTKVNELRSQATLLIDEVEVEAVKEQLQQALDATTNVSTKEEAEAAILALEEAVDRGEASVMAKDILPKMEAFLYTTNFYTIAAVDEYFTQWVVAYEEGTLTKAEAAKLQDPNLGTGWHADITVDNLLLSVWDTNPDFVDAPYYINTWSVEGNNDGTNFRVPFFEYWTGDGDKLADRTLTGTINNLSPGVYNVKVWVRVRLSNGVEEAPAGITMQVNNGQAVDVTKGAQVGTSQFYLDEFTAQGVVEGDGVLNLKLNVEGTNISWLSFKNAMYEYDDVATGINEVSTNGQTAGKVYNLNGQQVQAPVKGLFIMDGKKVVLK